MTGDRTIAVAVVVHEGRVLVGRRAGDAGEAAGLHEFPGGKVEPGESPQAAAARECVEETGIVAHVGKLVDRGTGPAARGRLEILFFAAVPLDWPGKPRAPFQWMPVRDLPACTFPPANARVLAALARDAKDGGETWAEGSPGDAETLQGGS